MRARGEGSSRPTVYDVAARADVSIATVSRYFRAPDRVRSSTAERVRAAVEALGYLPSGAAQGLAERQTGVVGLYSFSGHEPDELEMPEPSDARVVREVRGARAQPRPYPLFADEVLRGVELECTVRGLPLAVGWQALEGGGVPIDAIARRVDGMIVLPDVVPIERLRRLSRQRALVLVAARAPRDVVASSVAVANAPGMRAIVEHLVTVHGHRRLWYVGHSRGLDQGGRWRGASAALDELGVGPPAARLATTSRAETRAAVAARLDDGDVPDAIVCASDQAALGALEALGDAGVRVPDVAVTGFDGIDAGGFARPSLTTVRQPMDALGRVAVRLVAERLAGGAPRSVTLPVELLVRESCGCAP